MRRKSPTRRKRAFYWLGVLALVLGLTLYRYDLTPERAWRSQEESQGTGATQVLWELGTVELGDGEERRVTLLGNDRALLLSTTRFLWNSGWSAGDSAAVDRTGGGLSGGWVELGAPWLERQCYGFGCVDDPAILRVEFQVVDLGTGRTLQTVPAPKEEWKPLAGGNCFVVTVPQEDRRDATGPLMAELVGYGADDAVLVRKIVGDIGNGTVP